MRRRDERRDDPQYDLRVGQLIGATIMVGHMLSGKDDPEIKRLGERLLEQAAWFITEEPSKAGHGV